MAPRDGILDGFQQVYGCPSSGSYTSDVDKLCIHFTQGNGIEGAISTLISRRAGSHTVVEGRAARGRRRVQLINQREAARSLRNESGGVQTNRDGVVQVELVGFSEHPEQYTEADWLWVGREVIKPMCEDQGVPIVCTVVFHSYPPTNGERLGRESYRFTFAEWAAYKGIHGHQHVPENSHGDPGALSAKVYRGGKASAIDLILEGALGAPKPPTDPWEQELVSAKQDIIDAIYAAAEVAKPKAVRVRAGSSAKAKAKENEDGRVYVIDGATRIWVNRKTLDAGYVLGTIRRDKDGRPDEVDWDQIAELIDLTDASVIKLAE